MYLLPKSPQDIIRRAAVRNIAKLYSSLSKEELLEEDESADVIASRIVREEKPAHTSKLGSWDVKQNFEKIHEKGVVQRNLKPSLQLRDYQNEIMKCCLDAFAAGKKRIGVSLATGGGKTVILSNLIGKVTPMEGKGNKALVLVHRAELAQQAAEICRRTYPHLKVDIEMGPQKASEDADITIASVQTLVRGRINNLDPKLYKLIIIDECHHAAAKSYIEILKHFGADVPNSDTYVVGFSATLERTDSKALSVALDEIVYHKDLIDMIKDNWLCDAKFTTVKLNVDLSEVVTKKGDFASTQLSKVLNSDEVNELVVDTYMELSKKNKFKTTLIFGADITHIKALHEKFQSRGLKSDYVTAKTEGTTRKETIEAFKNGELPILLNCGIFTEGTDIPNIDSILLVRPTKSRSLLIQMIGRGLRLHQDKTHCHIIDFVGSHKLGVQSVPTLLGLDVDESPIEGQEKSKTKSEEQEKKKTETLMKTSLASNIESLSLSTFDGFLNLIQNQHASMDNSDVCQEINSNILPWIRASYNVWILNSQKDVFLKLERRFLDENENEMTHGNEAAVEKVEFHLVRCTIYRSLGMKNRSEIRDTLLQSGSLEHVLASAISQSQPLTNNFTRFAEWRRYPASSKQKDELNRVLKPYVNKAIRSRPHLENELKSKVSNWVEGISKGDASNLIGCKHAGFGDVLHWKVKSFIGLQGKEIKKIRKKVFGMSPDEVLSKTKELTMNESKENRGQSPPSRDLQNAFSNLRLIDNDVKNELNNE